MKRPVRQGEMLDGWKYDSVLVTITRKRSVKASGCVIRACEQRNFQPIHADVLVTISATGTESQGLSTPVLAVAGMPARSL